MKRTREFRDREDAKTLKNFLAFIARRGVETSKAMVDKDGGYMVNLQPFQLNYLIKEYLTKRRK